GSATVRIVAGSQTVPGLVAHRTSYGMGLGELRRQKHEKLLFIRRQVPNRTARSRRPAANTGVFGGRSLRGQNSRHQECNVYATVHRIFLLNYKFVTANSRTTSYEPQT